MKTNKPFIVSIVILAIVALVSLYVPSNPKYQPAPMMQGGMHGKLNINAICEGALSYMSFPDGTMADIFVTECKEGKHPEVIERFKADMNLGDGALY